MNINKSHELLKQWQLAVNEKVNMKPLPESKEWFLKLIKDTVKYLEDRCDKCGQLSANIGGEYQCSECGMPLVHDNYIPEMVILNTFQKMCEESLSPETFEQFENVKQWLIKTRRELIADQIPPLF